MDTNELFDYYNNNRENYSESANNIMIKIKNGYKPNMADIFELFCTDEEKINDYRMKFNIFNKVSKQLLTLEEIDYLKKFATGDTNVKFELDSMLEEVIKK